MNYYSIYHVVLKWVFQTFVALVAYYFSFLLAYGEKNKSNFKSQLTHYLISYCKILLLILGLVVLIILGNNSRDMEDKWNYNTIASYISIITISALIGTFIGLKKK